MAGFFFPFSTLNIFSHFLLVCKISVETFADSLRGSSLVYNKLVFFWCFQNSVFDFWQFEYIVSWCRFLWVYLFSNLWASWIWLSIFFPRFGKFSSIISLNKLSGLFSLSSLSGTSLMPIMVCLMLSNSLLSFFTIFHFFLFAPLTELFPKTNLCSLILPLYLICCWILLMISSV